MGECTPSGTLYYDHDAGHSELALEFWDRDYPDGGEEPRLNITATDYALSQTATAGLNFEQVRAVHNVLGEWLAADGQGRRDRP